MICILIALLLQSFPSPYIISTPFIHQLLLPLTATVAAKSNARAYQIAIMGDRLRITQFFFHTNGLDYDYIVCPKYSRKLIQFD